MPKHPGSKALRSCLAEQFFEVACGVAFTCAHLHADDAVRLTLLCHEGHKFIASASYITIIGVLLKVGPRQ